MVGEVEHTNIQTHTFLWHPKGEAKLGKKGPERFQGDLGHCTAGLQCVLNKKACLDISGVGKSAVTSFSCRSSWRDSWGDAFTV